MADDEKHMARRRASTLAANLVLAREASGVTQSELAARAGTSRATIAQIESGRGDPRLSTLGAIADALGVSVFVLLLAGDDLRRLVQLAKHGEIEEAQPEEEERALLKQLAESRLTADRRKAARMSTSVVSELGFESAGAAVGAAIGTALMPGLGTIVGAFVGGGRRRSKADDSDE
jgi:transcriptional regulator with XRE-family HTH domain